MEKKHSDYVDLTQKMERAKTIVCVTDQCNCDRIIKSASVVCELTATELIVINVSSPNRYQDPDSLEYLFRVSAQHGGQMTVLYYNDPAKAVIHYIKNNKVANVITGMPESPNSVLNKIWSKFTHTNFFMVNKVGGLVEVTNPALAARGNTPLAVLATTGV